MLKIAFCDDDLEILNELSILTDKYRLEKNQDIQYIAFQSPFELMAEIEKGMSIDILFLDVLMPGENGIDVAQEIRQYDSNMKIIFLTSSPEFAVESYTVNAYFYQLKPIWAESFFRLLDQAIAECAKEEKQGLIIRCKSGITRIDLDKLEYCEVMKRTLIFHLSDGTVLESNGSMEVLCSELEQYSFFLRPHRSYLINMEYIQNISGKVITLRDNTEIPIPHGKYAEIKDLYLQYAFERKQVFMP